MSEHVEHFAVCELRILYIDDHYLAQFLYTMYLTLNILLSFQHTVYGGYNRGFVTNGRKWRPDGSVNGMGADTISEAESMRSNGTAGSMPGMNGRYVILREDSTSSAFSFNMHYNTLHAIEHPHALTMGGFGESSTDATLPRTLRKKHSRSASGDMAETEFMNYPIDRHSRNSSRYASRESIISGNSLDQLGSRVSVKSTGSLKRGSHVPNGMHIPVPNGIDHNGPNTHRKFRKNSEKARRNSLDFDKHSQGTIDEADSVLDITSTRSLPRHAHRNPAFRDDEDQQWKPYDGTRNPHSQDSIVFTSNLNMFSYDNHAMDKSLPRSKGKGKRSSNVVDPPPEFRDPTIAIVQPVKGGHGHLHRQNAVDRNDNDLKPRKASHNSSKDVNRRHSKPVQNGVIQNGVIPVGTTTAYSIGSSQTLPTNRHRSPSSTSNGRIPNKSHDSSSLKRNSGKNPSQSSFLHQNGHRDWSQSNGHYKPSAQVYPQPKDADVRL